MAKAEISWRRLNEEGEKFQVYAQRVGGRWLFFQRDRRYDRWEEQADPPLEDWLELLDAVRRRVPRRKFPPDEVARIEQAIRERFPDTQF
ncbi:MAG: hypothetical protein HZA90_19745 [Verrucomicrobia bacterium]|nr:hypothetical protein [Verrucomicrobiota bacterium]